MSGGSSMRELGEAGAEETGLALLSKGDGDGAWGWAGGGRTGNVWSWIEECEGEQERAHRNDSGEGQAERDDRQGTGDTWNMIGAR